jgi:hypothetical protein
LKKVFTILAVLLIQSAARSGEPDSSTSNHFKMDDFLVVPLRVHLLSSETAPDLNTTFNEKDLARVLPKMNRVWAQAGVCFYIESLLREEARAVEEEDIVKRGLTWLLPHRPVKTRATNAFNIYYIKQFGVNGVYFPEAVFVKDTAALRPVEGGIDEPIPRVTSHELGHALGLPHRQNTTNLMASGTTGTWLNETEIKTAREAARKIAWIRPASEIMKQVELLRAKGNVSEARIWSDRVTAIPLPH